ncbi:hypothetical protein BDV95DRAFT_603934 [Massariosphaeria phaeospora]|uniref:Midasin n=1 Tax=Massariosphaeria phaeospora TaxID=100035 RepID=A0A7C8IEJ9_9PLEO|nr:hypothetical protein BDV95DRAFT_603934 [Massariosphaeria phaeospora]
MEGHITPSAGKTVTIESLATDALNPKFTDGVLLQHEGLLVEICARWISSGPHSEAKIAAFGRILPLAPHLAEHAERFLASSSQVEFLRSRKSAPLQAHGHAEKEPTLLLALLGTFRLLSSDCRSFSKYVRPAALERLFRHSSRAVRYLAVRVFCTYAHAADHATQEMLKRYVGEENVSGEWEGRTIDYRFLSLWEEKRWSNLQSSLQAKRREGSGSVAEDLRRQLSPYTVDISGILLPRLDGVPSEGKPSDLVTTPTTASNLKSVAQGLLGSSPLLLTGLAGSGKTLLVRHFAWHLNKLNSMVTLHLNEQSDAKLLVGMYATGSKPGTFNWRPGVLTTAVKEGRWIFIEDLDRAPNDVISTLLPLIERGELLIPSRGESIRAARGFRIIATMRSTLNSRGQEIIPRQNMIGHRFWTSITVDMPALSEFREIISTRYSTLEKHIPGIMGVYARLLDLCSDAKFSSENGTSLRALTPRDLLKWCDRVAVLLAKSSSFNAARMDDIFMEALDCFAGSLRSDQMRVRLMACVAEELHIDPQRRDHLLRSREVKLEVPAKSTGSGTIRIGRASLARHRVAKRPTSGRPFSTNDYTLRLLEKIAVAVDRQEPLLLVGETGTGKTTCIQYLAEQLGRKLVAFNLSQQSESGDLLGGYKPVNVRSLIIPLKDEFDDLFDSTFSRKKNERFINMLGKRVAKGEWKRVCLLWSEALKMVDAARKTHESQTSSPDPEGGQPKKKRKVDSLPAGFPKARWQKFATDLHDLEAQLANGSEAFAFSFLEGNIVKAVRNGDWVLLDEINLASSDTLEALADLLGGGPDGTPSILLTETGNVERVVAHPNFRVFAAMNPATDVGKKDLPPGIRSRFTELYVESPDSDKRSLCNIVEKYLGGETNEPAIIKTALDVTNLYLDIQQLAKANMLVDGADQKAHFSLRTLTRTLSYANDIRPLCTLRRALYEGFHISFLTFLGKASEDLVAPLITQHLFPHKSSVKTELGKPLQQPSDERSYVRQGHYWLRQGIQPVEEQPHYIITPFVQRNMNNLIRAASTRRYPVLIQGPTSSGKTSMIEYLAKRSGNKFVRINNHEHTDLQEYLGSYVSGVDGKLTFQEGILVQALREGHWIVLDELNLAPTDVLEALNRLLDDNRELLIPETQEVVRPHEDFMLFATQNPAGLYGGRKILSRAFRNRFLELHFDDIPVEELTEILHRRTMIPESWCKRIVKVYEELSTLRQENRLFEQKSFATLRDLFRWAQRKADTIQDLASNGYMLLAERVRKDDERIAVKKIIETVMSRNGPRVQIDEDRLYSENASDEIGLYKNKGGSDAGVVWTRAMRRLFVLVANAIRNNEPVLLVGETGCGKTTVCQMLADAFDKQLHIVNAHQNTETGDLIGAQRPIRNRAAVEELLSRQLSSVLQDTEMDSPPVQTDLVHLLDAYDNLDVAMRNNIPVAHREQIQVNRIKAGALFEWADGSLVHAMKTGQFFLLDEISLADDSVLERLNSVLEPSRTLLLAEKGPTDSFIAATDDFQFLATMNPGGDYGKKELSPALRNRFTEIWVPALADVEDILQIVRSKLKTNIAQHAGAIVSFAQWFNEKYNTSVASSISIRDTLAWVSFINNTENDDPVFGLVHGASMVFIDTLGANPAGLLAISASSISEERQACLHRLSKLLGTDVGPLYFDQVDVVVTDRSLQLGSFSIPKVSEAVETVDFSFDAPTTRSNAMRVVRALQLPKPILLEGNPGVGKTTLITAIAKAIGKPLTRLNLSEQTDLMDLFGSDVPVEGGQAGTFAWRDAPFLKAMKNGNWVLLDEMNLASQSVLEGLNAVLDHRGKVYISELDQTFQKHPDFRVFAAQNPHHQGGGRKGLPASFVNRFTVVYAEVFRPEDLALICAKVFPNIEEAEVRKLINFVAELDDQVVNRRAFGALGSPWEFNLRDTLRWLQLLASEVCPGSARDYLDTVFVQRFRTETDRLRLLKLFESIYGTHRPRMTLYHNLSPDSFQVGLGLLRRNPSITQSASVSSLRLSQLGPLEALMVSVRQNWPVVIVGPSGSGKTIMVDQLASLVGANMVTFSMNADIDAMDLVGGYEQIDPSREIHHFLTRVQDFVRREVVSHGQPSASLIELIELIENGSFGSVQDVLSLLDQITQDDQSADDALQLLHDLQHLLGAPQQIDGARFHWVDGILIQALEQGKWLVLDNANLCSSAVLDRLNSLLEPNGYLSVNEHATSDGEARIIRPHPDFRIFMTMDPRFGELSRAMRNRAVEICLLTDDSVEMPQQGERHLPSYALESQLYRFRHFGVNDKSLSITIDATFENLSTLDTHLLQSFVTQASSGLVLSNSNSVTNGSLITQVDVEYEQIRAKLSHDVHYLSKRWQARAVQYKDKIGCMANNVPSELLAMVPYHPLNNELCSNGKYSSASLSVWFASMYDFEMDLHNMQQAIQIIPSTKFERRKEKQKLPGFLRAYLQVMMKCVEEIWKASEFEQSHEKSLEAVRTLFWAFLEMTHGSGFDRATFQTYLKMYAGQVSAIPNHSTAYLTDLTTSLSKEATIFGSEVKLTTGLGMERIWRYFKPTTPKTQKQLQGILSLEGLADRLDAAMWRSNLSLDGMIQIRDRFSGALELARTQDVDAVELITNLEDAVRELEERVCEEDVAIIPYFEDEFEGLCQFLDLARPYLSPNNPHYREPPAGISVVRAKSSLLARRRTKLSPATVAQECSPQQLSTLARFVGPEQRSGHKMVLQERFHISLLGKLGHSDEVSLAQLNRFEAELFVLAQHVSLDCNRITNEQQDAIPGAYRNLANHLTSSHSDVISSVDYRGIQFTTEAQLPSDYRLLLEGSLTRCIAWTRKNDPINSEAWVQLALAGLSLYIPNYPHDPALWPMIERKLFNRKKSSFEQKLQGLQQFQKGFTGQDTSLRIRQIEEAIHSMGGEPPVPPIVRPEVSELDALQGEFTNLLSMIRPLVNGSRTVHEASLDDTLRQNISHISRRLSEGYRSYDDITAPAVGFLACLDIGLSLGVQEQEQLGDIAKCFRYISSYTPFFGLHGCCNTESATLIEVAKQEFTHGQRAVDLRWHALHTLVIIRGVDRHYMSDAKPQGLLHDIFSSFYSEWKSRLLQEQDKEAKNRSLYSYRGDDEEADEEDPDLFPDYEREQEVTSSPVSTSREHTIRHANIHSELFNGGDNACKAITDLLEWCSTEIARVSDGKSYKTSLDNALPAILMALQKKSNALSSSNGGRNYNFYFDANLSEAKHFVTLIHRIQHRYRQIQMIWPEHATLADVLRTCDEALAFRHVDPIAKIITKAEKLHGYIYEWQRLASRELSTANLYDDLTKLLVSWRQLELTTWARLFDMETEKCRDDAKSWFFVAYETIVAASESISDEESMKIHARELLKTLEGFFSSTTLGQFQGRLTLLQQLLQHIAMRLNELHGLRHIHLALQNFIEYFSRLKQPVHEALIKGRQTLEKEVNDVIKLASWKDTNIEALRQSAKTSHRKLSKLVRKFRKLLNQPVSGIYKSGFPDESAAVRDVEMTEVLTGVRSEFLELCAPGISIWDERPSRYKNLPITVSMMRRISTPSAVCVDGATYVDSFITDLELSIAQLQKATPNILTEENKETVQHLKTRKRKLYADTMKELRQMGIKSNLSSDLLAKQDDLSTILAALPAVSGTTSEHAQRSEYFLHKSLSILPQVRDVTREHSGDLTGNDVARSIGYLEGLLQSTIRQRGMLSKASEGLKLLQGPMAQVAHLCDADVSNITSVSEQQMQATVSLQPSVSWLSTMLKTGSEVVAAQAQLGKTEDLDHVVSGARDWSAKLRQLSLAFDQLPILPTNVWSAAHQTLDTSVKQYIVEVREAFDSWHIVMPNILLKHVEPSFFNYPIVKDSTFSENQRVTLDDHVKDILHALDSILGSMQDVETSLINIPASTEDTAWLAKEEQALYSAISALHTPRITQELEIVLGKMQYLHENENLRVGTALLAAVQPILKQYVASCEFLYERFAALHLSSTKLLYRLSKSLILVGSQGFCQPSEKSADQQAGKDEKLESGTGLGEGEGAEDISKDIEEDEDLEDLAQEKSGEREGSIEEEEDAVDMGEQEMEGETGDVAEKEDEDGEGDEGDDDVQSEVGSVDDLGPSAVDEKMWDEGGKEDDAKDKEGNKDVGTENKDEQVAADQKDKKDEDSDNPEEQENKQDDEEMEMEGDEQEEDVGVGETEKMDPHAKEEETLDLPDELNIDGNDEEKEDKDLGDMDMDEDLGEEEMDAEVGAEPDNIDNEIGPEQEEEEQKDTSGHVEDEEDMDDEQEGDEPVDDDAIPLPDDHMPDEEPQQTKDDQQSDPNAEAGAGMEANEEAHQNQNEETSASAANRDDGNEGEGSEQKQETTAEDGTLGQASQPEAGGRGEEEEQSPETQSFKKLGDVLERWYNQQRQISDAKEKDESQVQQIDKEVDMADADFEHVPDDETQADTQALGTATEDQAKALDQDMGMAVDEDEEIPMRPDDSEDQVQDSSKDVDMRDEDLHENQHTEQPPANVDGRPQAFVGEQKPFSHEEDQDMQDALSLEDEFSDTSSVDDVENQLELTHLEPVAPVSTEDARALWINHEASTHSLSQQLTEHLRLILAPTLATKLRGDFRTGKRLNLKRIIPYIASGYKRDKIWLRRSQPSKRSYQVLIALDDSKSMAESGASNLALKTLTLVTRSLAMLEVGEVSVVGFGDSVNVAHDFDKPFTSDAGVRVFEQFGFAASKTNVRGLVERSLELFAEARRKGSSAAGEDLWQLMLVVSDGICDSHAEIQRLVRRAQEERVMIVFVIIDSSNPPVPAAPTPASTSEAQVQVQAQKPKDKTSILDLQSVEITPDGRVVRWKYMERFPFRYYLVVRDVRELPGVLAGALRQWFGEVVGSA